MRSTSSRRFSNRPNIAMISAPVMMPATHRIHVCRSWIAACQMIGHQRNDEERRAQIEKRPHAQQDAGEHAENRQAGQHGRQPGRVGHSVDEHVGRGRYVNDDGRGVAQRGRLLRR